MDEQKEAVARAALAGGIVVAGTVWYALISRKERGKRKKIQEWEQMNLSAIAASRRRMLNVLIAPESTSDNFWQVYHEETAFMKLIHDQPMY